MHTLVTKKALGVRRLFSPTPLLSLPLQRMLQSQAWFTHQWVLGLTMQAVPHGPPPESVERRNRSPSSWFPSSSPIAPSVNGPHRAPGVQNTV